MKSGKEVLSSHGILVDADKKTLTIQSRATQQDFVYDLTDSEVKKLTDNSLKSTPMKERLGILNRVISGDFQDKITMDTLNSRETVSLRLKPEVEAQLQSRMVADDKIQLMADPLAQQSTMHRPLTPSRAMPTAVTWRR